MAKKEILGLEIEVDSAEVDKTDKKLRSLDKLLQQTQRRAAALGKTKITPKISLDDHFTSAAEKVKRTLTQIHRIKAQPKVHLMDNVSGAVARIHGSLIGMTAIPWRVSVKGIYWDGVVGGSFRDWMSAEGQSTLRNISSSIGAALGSGLKGVMMQALGLAELPKELIPKRRIDFPEEDRNLLMDQEGESIYAKAGRMAGERFFRAFLGVIDPNQISEKLGSGVGGRKTNRSDLGGLLQKKFNSSTNTGSVPTSEGKWLDNFITDVFKERSKGIAGDWVDDFINNEITNIKGKWKDFIEEVEKKPSSLLKQLEPAKKWVDETALPFIKKGTDWIKKFKLSYFGTAIDVVEIATADPGRDRAEKIGGAIGGAIGGIGGTVLGSGFASALLAAGLSVILTRTGELVGGGLYDAFTTEHEPIVYSDQIMAPSVQGVTRPEKPQLYVARTPVPDVVEEKVRSPVFKEFSPISFLKPIDYLSSFERYKKNQREANDFSMGVQGSDGNQSKNNNVSFNITLPPGAVNLTVNKDELNYEEISKVTARKITNEIRLAMQNIG